jgi:NAD kinase
MSPQVPRAVVVTRKTEYQRLLEHHGTREQARFFLETREQSIDEVEAQHRAFNDAFALISRAIPLKWRRSSVGREDLDRFLFEPDDLVIALGQDGLVANTAKYLSGQTVLGFNPSPDRYDGILVPLAPKKAEGLIRRAYEKKGELEERTMVHAELDDGQSLVALNELFLGHRSHQSARYRLLYRDKEERQSSSGIIVSTGTGSTGWARSVHRERSTGLELPKPTDRALVYFVREAFPSRATGTSLTSGRLDESSALSIVSEMNEGGVLFGDGIEDDHLALPYGSRVTIRVAATKLCSYRG